MVWQVLKNSGLGYVMGAVGFRGIFMGCEGFSKGGVSKVEI